MEEQLKKSNKEFKDLVVSHAKSEVINTSISNISEESLNDVKRMLLGIIRWFDKNEEFSPADMREFIRKFSRVFILENFANLSEGDEYVKIGNKDVNIRNLKCVKIKGKTFDINNCILAIYKRIKDDVVDKDFTGSVDIMNMNSCILVVDDEYNFTGQIITGYYVEPENYCLSKIFSDDKFYSFVEIMSFGDNKTFLVKNKRTLIAEMKNELKPYVIETEVKNIKMISCNIDSISESAKKAIKEFFE